MATMQEMKTAQDALTKAVETAVSEFVTKNPEIELSHLTVSLLRDANNKLTPEIRSSVSTLDEGARITRNVPN